MLTGTEVAWTLLCNLAIFCNSLIGLILWKFDILHVILLEMVALNVGTLMGVCIIEIIPSIYSLVQNGTLMYIPVTVLYMFGWCLGFTIEKLLKRGKGNKYKRLLQATGLDQENGLARSINSTFPAAKPPQVQFTTDADAEAGIALMNLSLPSPETGPTDTNGNPCDGHSSATVVFHTENEMIQIQVPRGINATETSPRGIHAGETSPQASSTQRTHLSTPASSGSLVVNSKPALQAGTQLLALHDEKLKMAKKISEGQDLGLIIIMLIGDMIHDFVDGGVLAAAFFTGPGIGLATFIGIFLEEIPHLTATFAVFVQAGAPIWKSLALNLFGAAAFLLGGGIVLGILTNPNINPALIQYLLPFAVGSFQYVAMVDLIPLLTMFWHGYIRAATQLLAILVGILIQAAVRTFALSQGAAT